MKRYFLPLFLLCLIFLSTPSIVQAITCCSTATNCTTYANSDPAVCTNGTFKDQCCSNSQNARLGPWCTLNGPFGGYNTQCQDNPPPPINTPTPTPVTCLTPEKPISLNGSCTSSGTSATVSWSSATRATAYNLRIDDTSNGWTGTCSSVNPGDTCRDNLATTSFTFTSIPGHSYNWWVDAANNCGGASSAYGGLLNCLLPTPTSRIAPTATPTLIPTPTVPPITSLVCNSISGPNSLLKGASASLTSVVTYTGIKPLNYSWSKTCDTGSFDRTNTSSVTFQAPNSIATCGIILVVSELNGKSSRCSTTISITDSPEVSGYVVIDKGSNLCFYDPSDEGKNGTVTLYDANLLSPQTTTTGNDSNGKSGYYKFSNLTPGNVYNIVYTLDTGDESTCGGPQRSGAKLTYSFTLPGAGLTDRNFYIKSTTSSSPAWFQTKDGDTHSNTDYRVNIPDTQSKFADYLVTSLNGPFFRYSQAQPINAWELASNKNWYIWGYHNLSYFQEVPSKPFFNYFSTHHPAEKVLATNVTDLTISSDLNRVFTATPLGGTMKIPTPISLDQSNALIYYIDGTLQIDVDNAIQTKDNSVAIFVISGDLNIKSTVTTLDGVYFVDGTINTSYDVISSLPLTINGMLYTSTSGKIFGQSRNLGSLNTTTPAELIKFQPKYLINTRLLEIFGKKNNAWEEVAG